MKEYKEQKERKEQKEQNERKEQDDWINWNEWEDLDIGRKPLAYCEEQPGEWLKKKMRRMRRLFFLQAAVGAVLLAVILLAKESYVKILACSVIFLSIGVGTAIDSKVKEKFYLRILKYGNCEIAVLSGFSDRRGKWAMPYFDFRDEKGLHHLPGYKKMKVSRQAEKDYIGQRYQVIYNAECPVAVLYKG